MTIRDSLPMMNRIAIQWLSLHPVLTQAISNQSWEWPFMSPFVRWVCVHDRTAHWKASLCQYSQLSVQTMRNGKQDFFNDNTTGPLIWQEQAWYMFYLLVLLFSRNLFEIHQIKVILFNKQNLWWYTGIDPDCYRRSIFSASSSIRLEISMKFVL